MILIVGHKEGKTKTKAAAAAKPKLL